MTNESLVSRLIWLLTTAMAGLWLLGSVTSGTLALFEVNERLDNALVEVAERLLPATSNVLLQPQDSAKLAQQLVSTLNPKALAYQILNPAGSVVMRSVNAPKTPFTLPLASGFHNVPRYRVYSQTALTGGYFIEVAEPDLHRHEALRRTIGLAALPLLFFLPALWILIRWVVRRGTRSLIQLQQEIGQRDGSNMSSIPDLPLPVELMPIHTALNRLLDRLRHALENERQFAANSAHELRTPIAALLAQLQVLSAELLGSPHADRVHGLVRQVKALGQLAEKLLQFSRTGGILALRRERIAVLPVLQLLINDFQRQDGVGNRLRLTLNNAEELIALTDLDVLGIGLRNLLENAVRYGAPDEAIDVIIDHDNCVRVLNGGEIVPPETMAEIKLPFRRGTTVGLGGGLGLAIVENIMT